MKRGTSSEANASQSARPRITWDDVITVESSTSAWGRMLPEQKLVTWTLHPTNTAPTVEVARISDDWTEFQVLASIDSPQGFIQEQSHLVQLPDGNLLMAVRKRSEDLTWFGLPVFRSTDGGRTWEEISEIDTNPDGQKRFDRGLWEPFLFILPDGRLSAFYASELHADKEPWYSQTLSQRISDDGGLTWGEEILAVGESAPARPGMPGVARMADGRVMLVYEVCGTTDCLAFFKISNDGFSWEEGLGTIIPEQRSGPFVAVLSTGETLVTSACTNEISMSVDNGTNWEVTATPAWDIQCELDRQNPPYTWPAIYELEPGTVVIVANVAGKVQMRFGHID